MNSSHLELMLRDEDEFVVNEDGSSAQDSFDTEKSLSASTLTLPKALSLWVEITGVEPGKHGSFTMGDWGIKRLHGEIQEALDLDKSEITGLMLFAYIVQNYFEERTFTLDQLLHEEGRVRAFLDKSHALASFLRSERVLAPANAFVEQVRLALAGYGALNPEVRSILSETGNVGDRGFLAVLRRDAMRTLERLQVNQFLDGEPEAEDFRPVYGRFVYRWDNINSMLRAMVSAPSGITINMIQSASNPYGVYFVFAIRNGGRLFVFTDKEAVPHPLAEGMWRRPDKVLDARANRNWFPYDLAGMKYTEDGRAYIDSSAGRSLVQYQDRAMPMKAISELEAPQVLWIAMMLDLIVDKFWHQGHREKQLSYTGEMLRVATPLLDAARKADLPLAVRSTTVLEVKPITLADVHTDKMLADGHLEDGAAVGNPGDVRNRWLEERYANKVLPETVDLIAGDADKLLVAFAHSEEGAEQRKDSESLRREGQLVVRETGIMTEAELEKRVPFSFDRDRSMARIARISGLDATSFGTQEELERDRLYIARANYARQIDKLAEMEFNDRKDEIRKWVNARVMVGIDRLRPIFAMTDSRTATTYDGESLATQAFDARYYPETRQRDFVKRRELDADVRKNLYYELDPTAVVLGKLPLRSGLRGCIFTGSVSSYLVKIIPETTEQLAWLCGVEVSGLPDVLQHWTQVGNARRNIILQRVDPLEGLVDDPWNSLHFKICAFLSKRALSEIEKEAARSPWTRPACWAELAPASAPGTPD